MNKWEHYGYIMSKRTKFWYNYSIDTNRHSDSIYEESLSHL